MPSAIGLVLLGLVLLAIGGDWLVRGAVAIARLAGLTPAVIGLTVVALGTSLPELVVSVIASVANQPDLAVGNVVGSNIFNITLILGVTALTRPLSIRGNVVKVEWPIMFAASVVCLVWSRDQSISRPEAMLLLVMLVLVVLNSLSLARREAVPAKAGSGLAASIEDVRPAANPSTTLAVISTSAGVGLLVLGGKLLVEGAVDLALLAGLSERVIGLTVVAAGTSAPELATSVMAALRGRSDIAVANLIGSNIFNVLGILGVAGVITPLTVSPAILSNDMWWMIATALLFFLLMRTKRSLSRVDGAILVAAYGSYLFLVLRN